MLKNHTGSMATVRDSSETELVRHRRTSSYGAAPLLGKTPHFSARHCFSHGCVYLTFAALNDQAPEDEAGASVCSGTWRSRRTLYCEPLEEKRLDGILENFQMCILKFVNCILKIMK